MAPLYEFKCPECGKVDEVLCKYTDPEPDCETCSTAIPVKMRRKMSASSLKLVGPGWARDNYGLKGGKK